MSSTFVTSLTHVDHAEKKVIYNILYIKKAIQILYLFVK